MIGNLFAPLAMKVSGGIIALLLGACLFLYLNGLGEARRADKWQARAGEEAAAHKLTEANYRRVRAEQKAADAEHARKVEQTQAAVTNEVSRDYQAALADLRRRYDALRLRPSATTVNSGSSRGADLSGVSQPAGRFDAAASASEDDFNAAANFLQLEALQKWVRDQLAIER